MNSDPANEGFGAADACRRFAEGDPAVAAAVRHWCESVVRGRYGVPQDEAEDIVAVATVQVLEKARDPGFRIATSFRAFVCHVARMRTIEHWRRRYAGIVTTVPDAGAVGRASVPPAADRAAGEGYRLSLLEDVFMDLTYVCRLALRSVFLEGLSYAAAADRAGCAVGTMKANVHRCLRNARGILAQRLERDRLTTADLWSDA